MKFIRTHLATIIVGIVVIAVLVGAFVAADYMSAQGNPHGGLMVVVHDGEGHEQSAPLEANNTLDVQTSLGRNVVTIENGKARMTEADCPHGNCLQQQAISEPGQQIICLPHQLWVEIVAEGNSPSQLDTAAVSYDKGGSSDPTSNVDLVAR